MQQPHRSSRFRTLLLGAAVAAMSCGGGGRPGTLTVDVGYDEQAQQIQVIVSRGVDDDETLHARVRQGHVGELDCTTAWSSIPRIDGQRVDGSDDPTYAGPIVDPIVFESLYDASWLEQEPTPEMLEQLEAGEHLIDICLMKDGEVVRELELDVRRALDEAGLDGKFDGSEEERIASTEAYADACVAELGEIPFFPRLGDGDYGTYNCLDSVAIPTTVTDESGHVALPQTEVDVCDEPQYIYSLCEPNAVDGQTNGPRVNRATNEQGTHWVLLCRKAKQEEGAYNDIAMIGHNPFTGKTCFFQNALYSRTDGLHVPHPGDRTESDESPEKSLSLWNGIHGGLGSGIQCAKCHDADPFIHSPWIDQAMLENGDPVVPKMGIDEDFALGYNDAPYSIINTEGQGWSMPQHLVSEEASACTKCHRIADGRWADDWFDRLEGKDLAWTEIVTPEYQKFVHTFWMPPDVDGLDEETWDESEYARAMQFIRTCNGQPDNPECDWQPLPTEPINEDGGLPEIELEGRALATEALATLGAPIQDPTCEDGDCASRRCSECHAVSRPGLRHWERLTDHALSDCRLGEDPELLSEAEAQDAITCLRLDPGDPASPFAAEKLGIMTTGVQYGHFRKLFRRAYGEDQWLIEYTRFKRRVGMPKGSHPKLSQREYAVLLKWFGDDLVDLENVLEEVPPPESCSPFFDQTALAAHIDDMSFEGWAAVNADNGVHPYGCPTGADPLTCFETGGFADRTTTWGGDIGTIRQLHTLDFRTSFWMRTSADGRFVGNGGGTGGATITDLAQNKNIAVEASYDPGFFPDNSGFIFQGSVGGAGICAQSLLLGDDHITFDEDECIKASGINLYQHVARGLHGGDYFVINSQFTSDSGSGSSDPSAPFSASSTMKLTPMVFDGVNYDPLDPVIVESPYEGDSVLSPSSRLVASRLAGADGDGLGYVVRRLDAAVAGDGYIVDITEKLATLCGPGAKVSFSFDERFMVTHHYEDGVANIYLIDLLDGQRHQVTRMPAGTKALFPHFVTSGWFYFLVQGPDGERFVAASDAALQLAAG